MLGPRDTHSIKSASRWPPSRSRQLCLALVVRSDLTAARSQDDVTSSLCVREAGPSLLSF